MSDSPTPLMTTFGPTQRPQASRGDVWLPQSTAVDSALTTSSPSRVDIQEREHHTPPIVSFICHGVPGVFTWQCTISICHCPTGSATPPVLPHTSSSPPAPTTPSFPSPVLPPNGGSSDPPRPPQPIDTTTNRNDNAPTGTPTAHRSTPQTKPSEMLEPTNSGPKPGDPGSLNAGAPYVSTTTVTATPSTSPYSGQVPQSPESFSPSLSTSHRAPSSLSSLSSSSRRFPLGAIIGIVFAVAITLLLLGVWWWRRRRLRRARSWAMLAEINNDQLTEVSYGYSSWMVRSGGYTTRTATPTGVRAASVLSQPAESHFRDSLIQGPPPLSPRTPSPLPFGRRTSAQPDVPRDITPNGSTREAVGSKGAGVVMAPEKALSLSTSLFSDGASSKHMSLRPQ